MRLLPVLVAVSSMALFVKVGGVWEGFNQSGEAFAQAAEEPQVEDDQAKAEDTAESVETPASTEEDQTASADQEETKLPKIQGLEADPFSMTDEEVELLQSLSARREQLEAREREFEQREVLLLAAERRIDEKIAELGKLQNTIEGLIVQHDEQSDTQMTSLVKIYESMKPKDAARIFEELDMIVLLDVVQRMKERKTAPILASMNPKRAKEITLELAQRRDLPIAKE
ncbi:MotE family protein [Kiloniella antarctica]|uniref:Magnesium transporter MgtE N-terminal domain-containing protein n=1 Tax=Kiloniella antarctica TaxID=1550907 RepID=A0ABW5BR43_9PROT